jgi:hypothetical protein
MRRRRKHQLGDVFTIACPSGRIGLAQYAAVGVHWQTSEDWLRVNPVLFDEPPSDPCAHFGDDAETWLERCFLNNLIRFKDVEFLASCPAPSLDPLRLAGKSTPLCDMAGRIVDPWHVVVEGEQEHWFQSLPPEFDDLPSLGITIGNTLGRRLDEGWTPRREVGEFGRVAVVGQQLPLHLQDEDQDDRPVRRDTAIERWFSGLRRT